MKLKPLWLERPRYDDNGRFDGTDLIGLKTENLSVETKAELRRSLDALLAKMPASKIVVELTKMAVVMKSRERSSSDMTAMLVIYAADLVECSTYGLLTAFAEIRRKETFFPSLAEILAEVHRVEKPYRTALRSLTYEPKTKRGTSGQISDYMADTERRIREKAERLEQEKASKSKAFGARGEAA